MSVNCSRLYQLTDKPAHGVIPMGKKEDVHYTIDNSENIAKRNKRMKSDFTDDCGVWNTKTTSTKKTEFLHRDGTYVFVLKQKGLYGTKKNGFTALTPQPAAKDIVFLKRCYATLLLMINTKKGCPGWSLVN